MTKINHDRLFKELITTFFVEFLELFFPEVLEYLDETSITFVEQELFTDLTKGEKKILDVVALAKFREQDYSFLIHLENQASNQTDFNRRMFRYFCSLFLKYDRPIYPIALLSYDFPKRAYKDNFVVELPQFSVLNFNYKLIQLNRLDWRNFVAQKNPVAAALMSKMQIATEDRPRVKAECLRLLVTLKLDPARMQLISGFVDTYLKLDRQEQETFQTQIDTIEPEEQEKIMQITTSWKEEGKLEGQKNTILRLLNKKLGSLSQQTVTTIKSLDAAQLDRLTEELLDFESIAELEQWLEQLEAN